MANIKTSLQNAKDREIKQTEQSEVVKEVKLLMDSDAQEDLRIFRALGKNHSIAVSEDEMGKKLELEKLDGKYAGNVFTKDQIEKLAIKYNLRFLRAGLFCGKMDVQVAAKIKEFSKETDTEITNGALAYNFFILAPEKEFRLKTEVTRKMWDVTDPAIFYKIDENHYRLVHKWGTDFTILNRIQGIRNKSFWSRQLFDMAVLTLAVIISMYLLGIKASPVLLLCLIPIFIIPFVSQLGRLSDLVTMKKGMYGPGKWNSETKLR